MQDKKKIIADWEAEHYPLSNAIKNKMLELTERELFAKLNGLNSWGRFGFAKFEVID